MPTHTRLFFSLSTRLSRAACRGERRRHFNPKRGGDGSSPPRSPLVVCRATKLQNLFFSRSLVAPSQAVSFTSKQDSNCSLGDGPSGLVVKIGTPQARGSLRQLTLTSGLTTSREPQPVIIRINRVPVVALHMDAMRHADPSSLRAKDDDQVSQRAEPARALFAAGHCG